MKTLSNENFEQEWATFQSYLMKGGVINNFNLETLKVQLKNASCTLSEDTGCAYAGALIHHANLINAIALRLAKMVSTSLPVNEGSLAKVCCLQHLSKIEMYEPNDNQWEIENRGLTYKFRNNEGRLKFGERSIMRAMNLQITFTPSEWEAMRALDNIEENKNGKYFDNPLTMIVRMANEIAYQLKKTKA